MAWVERWVVMMALGGMFLVGPTGCVVAPVEPGYVVSPPVVVIRPYRHYHSHPYRAYYGWHLYGHRW